jgi:hypothetical protein
MEVRVLLEVFEAAMSCLIDLMKLGECAPNPPYEFELNMKLLAVYSDAFTAQGSNGVPSIKRVFDEARQAARYTSGH